MQIKKEKGSRQGFVTGCLSERYRPDRKRTWINILETELPVLLKALGADYKHELLGERLTTTPKITPICKIKVATDLVVFVLFHHARKHRKLLKN
jgi:ribosomal protein S12 methylthiotransferase